MQGPDDDIEAASRLLLSNSTTTTTLSISNNVSHFDKLTTNNAIKLNDLKRRTADGDGKSNHSQDHQDEKKESLLGKIAPIEMSKKIDQQQQQQQQQQQSQQQNKTSPRSQEQSIVKNSTSKNKSNTMTSSNETGLESDDTVRVREESNTIVGLKLFAIFSTLYFFMWSSSILSQAFNLASYHYAGHFIRTSGFLQNPLIGLMVGIITTVVFQSSGAVTSVLVTIVGSGVLTVRQSIPIIMGANLGTSVTNTVVSLFVYRNKRNFEIAMTAGIVHDMYNMMSVVFLLPIELLFHPLEISSMWMMNLFGRNSHTEIGELQFLSYLVKPLVDLFIMIDKEKTANLEANVIVPADETLVRKCCNEERIGNATICHRNCTSLFSNVDLSDNVICILLLIIAMVTLFTCLIFVIKITKSLLGGKILNWVSNLAHREYQFPYSMFVGYIFILVGLVITVILHSSGVFTSMLVPLAGGDVLTLMQIYELTLGSNVGTTATGIVAALSAQSKYPVETLQVALCHFIFNVAGILMFYTFPHTTLPIWASQKFGMMSAKNMWFSIAYLVIVFLVAPSVTMAIYFATRSG